MIRTENLHVVAGEFRLADVTLDVREREYFVVLGPTGAGKTVLLECIAGLLQPERGRVFLGGRDVTPLPPEQRRVGYLPQDYALFPHLTVRENLGFGLAIRRREGEIPAKIKALGELLGIAHLLDRRPAKLSGGEKQRVALGRALAVDPTVMLLDEPLSALDAATRERIGGELRRIHDRAGITSVHICHNFDETIRLADRVALLNHGRLVQVGTPEDIMRRPNCLFAATFVCAENILSGTAERMRNGSRIRVGQTVLHSACAASGLVRFTIRPDDVELLPDAGVTSADATTIEEPLEAIEDRGVGYALRLGGEVPLTALVGRPLWHRLGVRVGQPVRFGIRPEAVHVLPEPDPDADTPGSLAWRNPP